MYIYGIHWLPTAEYLTSYGFDTAKAAGLYSGFVADNGGPEPDWYHIVWPIQALSDPQAVLNKWNPALPQQNELFNTYWFVHNMATLGSRTKDIWAENGYSATVYKKVPPTVRWSGIRRMRQLPLRSATAEERQARL
ncbi:hypothetical protein ACFSQ7_09930 [Paenibacillus rhizoplanae]